MKHTMLIVGLGNPGPKYEDTRHNIGFQVVDELFSLHGGLGWQEKFKAGYSRIRMGSADGILLKPYTYMNLSGASVSRARQFYKLEIDNILVIHDDIDLDYGIVRLKSGGGTGGHKGIESCKRELGDSGFHRLRIGVGRPDRGDVSDFVLGKYTADERIDLGSIIERACGAVKCVAESGMTKAMNQFNTRQGDDK